MRYDRYVTIEEITVSSAIGYSNGYSLLHGNGEGVSIQLVYENGDGYAVLQVSNDGTNWHDVQNTDQSLSGTSSAFFDVACTRAAACRLKIVGASGLTGTIHKCGGSQ